VLPPRPLLALSLLAFAALSTAVQVQPQAHILPGEASLWEGQTVQVQGWVADLRTDDRGRARFSLAQQGTSLATIAEDARVEPGSFVVATGRIARLGGHLVLLVERPDGVAAGPAPDALPVALRDAAQDPAKWTDRLLALRGEVDAGRLRDGSTSIALGEGPWPRRGAIEVDAFLRYDASCLCHRLDAREVRPWTP
jgi:hypothetical protein